MKDGYMAQMTPEERELIEGVQQDFAQMKAKIKKLQKIQEKAGRGAAAQAAFASLTAVNVAHVECSDRMMGCFPDDGGVVVLGGGGR